MPAPILITPTLTSGIRQVWQQIGFDMPDDTDNEGAVEVCVDADRLTMLPSPDANNEFRALVAQHGYPKTFRALCRSVRLA